MGPQRITRFGPGSASRGLRPLALEALGGRGRTGATGAAAL